MEGGEASPHSLIAVGFDELLLSLVVVLEGERGIEYFGAVIW